MSWHQILESLDYPWLIGAVCFELLVLWVAWVDPGEDE